MSAPAGSAGIFTRTVSGLIVPTTARRGQTEQADRGGTFRWRRVVVLLDLAFIAALVWLLHLHWRGAWLFDEVQDPLGGLLPLVVPWAGALGGVMVSLLGAARHARDWNDDWLVWHLIRPVAGAVAATVAFAVVQTVLVTVDATTSGSTSALFGPSLTPRQIGLYGGSAFVVGFVDRVFFDLVGKVAKVLFASGGGNPPTTSTTTTTV